MKSIKQDIKPPKIPEYLIKSMFPDNDFYTTVCDLEEEYKYFLSEKRNILQFVGTGFSYFYLYLTFSNKNFIGVL